MVKSRKVPDKPGKYRLNPEKYWIKLGNYRTIALKYRKKLSVPVKPGKLSVKPKKLPDNPREYRKNPNQFKPT